MVAYQLVAKQAQTPGADCMGDFEPAADLSTLNGEMLRFAQPFITE